MWVWCRGSGKAIWGEKELEDGGGEEDRGCTLPPVRREQVVGGQPGNLRKGDGALSAPSLEVTGLLKGQVLLLGFLLYLQRVPPPLACTLSRAGSLGQGGDLKKGLFSLQLTSHLTRAPAGGSWKIWRKVRKVKRKE